AAVATGCGGSSPRSAEGSKHDRVLKYSQCMRTHGVPSFPDPVSSPNGGGALLLRAGPGTGIDPSSPSFQAAQKACAKYQPGGAGPHAGGIPPSAKAQALKFSACMRSHGVTGFPDPVFSGNGARLQLSGGINPRAPAFQAAQKACGSPIVKGALGATSSVGGPG
ncbi:MAG: hypothetical protein QOJ25_142, partial [Solirubrobacteraceae bacterium]|nr:hypothetical protein [Solirubrobacteraceae bacterium]